MAVLEGGDEVIGDFCYSVSISPWSRVDSRLDKGTGCWHEKGNFIVLDKSSPQ